MRSLIDLFVTIELYLVLCIQAPLLFRIGRLGSEDGVIRPESACVTAKIVHIRGSSRQKSHDIQYLKHVIF